MNRAAIFSAVRQAARPGLFDDPGHVLALDNLLDAFGVPHEGEGPADHFTVALDEVLHHEGGFVNHPRDPGGMTNLGVTAKTWASWTGRTPDEATMRGLTRDQVAPLYRANYWDAVKAGDLPPGLALCVFDFAVNAGPARAVRYLQMLAGVAQDGKPGPATAAAVQQFLARHGERAAVVQYQANREAYYRGLPTFATFGRGWLRRCSAVTAKALELVK